MNKVLFFAGIVFVLCSCKKDYVCECTFSPSGYTTKQTIKKVSKKTAKDACVSASSVVVDDSTNPPTNITVTRNCSLK